MGKWPARCPPGFVRAALVISLGCASLVARADSDTQRSRGEMLYSTHCLACHTEQMHWRDRGLVTDMNSLAAQVKRWETISRAGWNEDDIAAVSRYLNDMYYHFPDKRQEYRFPKKQ